MKPIDEVELPVSLSMNPYSGTWTKETAAHLLRRTLFGMTYPQIQQAVQLGMTASVDQLLNLVPTPPPTIFAKTSRPKLQNHSTRKKNNAPKLYLILTRCKHLTSSTSINRV